MARVCFKEGGMKKTVNRTPAKGKGSTALVKKSGLPEKSLAIELAPSEIHSEPVNALIRRSEERSVGEVLEQSNKIQELMKVALKEGQHYGIIPGTKKQSLLKPGAEKINFLFRIGTGDLQETRVDMPEGHREVTIKTPMIHIPTGTVIAFGIGSCSTMESKYRYRQANRKCPKCGKETIIKGKEEYGGGWLCYAKKGGCGAKWPDDAKEITSQEVGQVENKDIADVYNTVLKMAAKRSYVDGTIKASAASDFFTQDVEDMEEFATPAESEPRNVTPPKTQPPDQREAALADLRDVYAKMRSSGLFTAAELEERVKTIKASENDFNSLIDLQTHYVDEMNARKRAEA
jgi:hypothetical protein